MRQSHAALDYKLNFPYTEIVETSGYEFTAVSYVGNKMKVTKFTQELEVLWESSVIIGSSTSVTRMIQHSSSDDYIIFGTTTHSGGLGSSDMMVIRLNTVGQGTHAIAIGQTGSVTEYGKIGIETQDNGFLFLGNTTTYGTNRVIKLDSTLNLVWGV